MIELRNISKIYKTGASKTVKALDDVSLILPEKGMVFILGKSGCGKSTMLNILGGLDRPTSGEIVIRGRSGKNFKASDFDSYRNTFVGFIFQEYNVLPEFTVKQNVLLASELQNNRAGVSSLDEVMETVELKGLEARKPNTLSGGQKQRVAIARALIKNPEIILADEPTGALDSVTGQAVLETLRRLSENKLVVVVSHDREFAENYADRIIELHDGKIVADRTRSESTVALPEKVTVLEDGIHLREKADEELLAKLNELLGEKKTVTITLESDGCIHKNGFAETDLEAIEKKTYTPEESRFIRSKFPLKYAIRMGASGMKCKPFRLIMTILLTTCALTAFGFFLSLMTYNSTRVLSNTLRASDYAALSFAQYKYTTKTMGIFSYTETEQAPCAIAEAKEALNGCADALLPIYTYVDNTYGDAAIQISNLPQPGACYYPDSFYGLTPASEEDLRPFGCTLASGRMPARANEVLVSELCADAFVAGGYLSDRTAETIKLRKTEDLIGRTLTVYGLKLTVCGIFKCPMPPEKYDKLRGIKSIYELSGTDFSEALELSSELAALYASSPSTLLVVSDKFAETYGNDIILHNGFSGNFTMRSGNDGQAGGDDYTDFSFYSNYLPFDAAKSAYIIFTDENKKTLNKGELLISPSDLYAMCQSVAYYKNYETAEKEIEDLAYDESELYYGTRETMLSEIGKLVGYLKKNGLDFSNLSPEDYSGHAIYGLSCAGYYIDPDPEYSGMLIFSKSDFAEFYGRDYERTADICDTFMVPKTSNTCQILAALNEAKKPDNGLAFLLYKNNIAVRVAIYTSVIEICSGVFFWIGVVLAIFASLLLFNFIAVSITSKKKDIGILRALGARTVDVFKVFCSESLIIVSICFLLSATFSAVLVNLLDLFLINSFHIASVLFYYGPLQALAILLLGVLVAIVSTIIPVLHNSKKPPVDAIRAL